MAEKNDNDIYKFIVIIGTISFLAYIFLPAVKKVENYSTILGWIVGWIALYLIYRITKFIWPDLW